MSLVKPNIETSEAFSETFKEGERIYLHSIRTVSVNTQDYGKGEMVVLTVSTNDKPKGDYGIWGQYLIEQAKSAENGDFNKWYTIERRVIEGYSKKPVKCLWPAKSPDHDDIAF